jgi:hypothetical protein
MTDAPGRKIDRVRFKLLIIGVSALLWSRQQLNIGRFAARRFIRRTILSLFVIIKLYSLFIGIQRSYLDFRRSVGTSIRISSNLTFQN